MKTFAELVAETEFVHVADDIEQMDKSYPLCMISHLPVHPKLQVVLPCNHVFHVKTFNKYNRIKSSCFYCLTKFSKNELNTQCNWTKRDGNVCNKTTSTKCGLCELHANMHIKDENKKLNITKIANKTEYCQSVLKSGKKVGQLCGCPVKFNDKCGRHISIS